MANQRTKLDVALRQLGTAMDLFIRDRDPVAVQCLPCGGAELIEAIATQENVEPFSTHMLKPSLTSNVECCVRLDARGRSTLFNWAGDNDRKRFLSKRQRVWQHYKSISCASPLCSLWPCR
jgi:hypothetical protein